jgi:hypothetical protein
LIKDIVTCFFKVFYPHYKPNQEQAVIIFEQAKILIKKGWTVSNITNRIVNSYETKKVNRPGNLFVVVSREDLPPLFQSDNILKNKFYYHNRLQKISKPTEIIIDKDGNVIKKREPFYLEIIEKFTIEDLTNYFHDKMNIEDSNIYRLNKGGFKKIHKDYSLDLLLFSIDAAFKERKKQSFGLLTNYSEIYNYLQQGNKALSFAKNNGTGKEIPYFRAYLKMRGGQ